MSIRKIYVKTDGTGAYSSERLLRGTIRGIEVQLGDLSTPDIDITDDTYGTSFLSVNGLASSTAYFPGGYLQDDAGADLEADTGVKTAAPAVCLGVLKVAVTGGGANKRGTVVVLYEG